MNLSKDYKKLFELVTANEGLQVPCFVDYRWNKEEEPCRDIAMCRCMDGRIDVGARGIGYSDYGMKTIEIFIADCNRMNLEFVDDPPAIPDNELPETVCNFIEQIAIKDNWHFSNKDDLWHQFDYKSRTTQELYEYYLKRKTL